MIQIKARRGRMVDTPRRAEINAGNTFKDLLLG